MWTNKIKTPAYVIDEKKLRKNLEILHSVEEETGCHILLAQKCFSCFYEYPLIGQYISGTVGSGIYEARLGKECMGKENHVFAPAFKQEDMDELILICDHIVFNSLTQLEKYKEQCLKGRVSIGLRVNPECSTQEDHAIYDPCTPGSRFGVTADLLEAAAKEQNDVSEDAVANVQQDEAVTQQDEAVTRQDTPGDTALDDYPEILEGVEGLHFHTLCEQNSDDLATTLKAVEEKFGKYLYKMKWLNFGGGHHITREDYDLETLKRCILHMKETYDLEIYLEPGEAIALNAGYLVTEILDIVENGGIKTLVLDASAACHMPDVLEMPYRPPLKDSGEAGEKAYTYRLSSYTCLAGDVIGDYSFDEEMQVGDRLIFEDMAIYSMVKNNTFNGIPLPDIDALHEDGEIEVIRRFGYEDFKGRLA